VEGGGQWENFLETMQKQEIVMYHIGARSVSVCTTLHHSKTCCLLLAAVFAVL
jgi:hypothetical protein